MSGGMANPVCNQVMENKKDGDSIRDWDDIYRYGYVQVYGVEG